ncbi:hypothetical protein EJB05_06927, partial [Eragrostis curvula]
MRGRAAVTDEERRRNRMTSNRLSARKSRMKRQQHAEELAATAERLGRENETLRAGVDGALQQCRLMEQENRVLAAHARELHATLLLRNSQLRTLADFAGVPLDVPGVPDHLELLYGGGGAQMPPPPTSSPAALPLEIQMLLFQPDAMDVAAVGTLGF